MHIDNSDTHSATASIGLTDFLQYHFLSNVSLAPDDARVAFLRHKCKDDLEGYDSNLWVYDLVKGYASPLTSSGEKQVFCWTPDGVLLHATPEDETTFVRTSPDGQSQFAFTVPLKVKSIEAVIDSIWLIEATSPVSEEAGNNIKDDVCVVLEELPAQYNGQGYIAGTRNSLLLFDQPNNSLKKITPPHFESMGHCWCPDVQKLVCHGHDYSDVRGIRGSIYLYDVLSGQGSFVLEPNIYRIYYATMLGDKVMFAGTQGRHNSNENPTFYTLDPATGKTAEMCYPDHYVGGLGIGSDCRYGSGTTSMRYGDSLYFTAAHFESSHLFEVKANGSFRQVSREEGSVDYFDIKGQRAVFIGLRKMGLQELYTLDPATGQEVRLTDFNQDYLKSHKVCRPKPCYFKNRDDVTITGWVISPTDFDETRTYPAILDIHGGPKACYGMVFYHEMQLWANRGYFVFFCNPRGSDGHGDAYSEIAGINGTIDYDDIMEFTDHVLECYPQIDRARVGVTGGSYGGFMTNWIVGHTDRFAAAATQRSIGDWMVHYAACDSGFWVTAETFPPSPLYDPARAWDHSPGKYAPNIKTPLLFIHSDDDRRCPLSEMMSVYTGAALAGAPIRMCLFHGENHELSRSGKPRCRIKRLEEITGWMDKYLKGGDGV